MNTWIIKGDICYSTDLKHLETKKDAYLICENGYSRGVFDEIPMVYKDFELKDYSGCLIVPGLSDLHIHAPQYAYRGLGLDLELLEWLHSYAFPEESEYKNLKYAKKAYSQFVHDLKYSPTTRFCAFATIHTDATVLLMEMLEETGLKGYVGKVNMDRNSPDYYIENNVQHSLEETIRWIEISEKRFKHIKPVITPRFTPSCTDTLMQKLGELTENYRLPVQSHLSENLSEIEWVQTLCPWSKNYIDTYLQPKLIGHTPAVMAHCVYSDDKELDMIKKNGVFMAHCPQCNSNIASGIAPVRKWLNKNIPTGLGSDIAGGSSISIFRAMMEAMQTSKLVWRLLDQTLQPLSVEEIFYLGTKGGGAFFGKTGSFEAGYEMDVLVLNEERLAYPKPLSLKQRLERYICLSNECDLHHKYVSGIQIF